VVGYYLPPSRQAERPPLVGCPQLLIQYIRSYLPYLEAVSFIRNVTKRHAVMVQDPLNMALVNMVMKLRVLATRRSLVNFERIYKKMLFMSAGGMATLTAMGYKTLFVVTKYSFVLRLMHVLFVGWQS
jgi:hypothetical protein